MHNDDSLIFFILKAERVLERFGFNVRSRKKGKKYIYAYIHDVHRLKKFRKVSKNNCASKYEQGNM
jgi:hypothetical protein